MKKAVETSFSGKVCVGSGEHAPSRSAEGVRTTARNVEDEGPVSDLLNVDIATDADCVLLKQEKYVAQLVDTYLPDGVPNSFHKNHAPANDDLPRLVDTALLAKEQRLLPDPKLRSTYQSLVGALLYCATQT
eukprot:3593021-Pleurochrysis_carterae.AAC.3